jgi:hypothetical protein
MYAHHNRSISCVKSKSTTVLNIQNCVEYPWINKGRPNCTCQCGCFFHLWYEAISTCPTTLFNEHVLGSHTSLQLWSAWIVPHSCQHQKLGIVSSLDVLLQRVVYNHWRLAINFGQPSHCTHLYCNLLIWDLWRVEVCVNKSNIRKVSFVKSYLP